jgi:hypothetical protein
MALLKLKDGVVAIRLDDDGILVDTLGGRYMAINRTAYAMIEALGSCDGEEQALGRLEAGMAADRATLVRDIGSLRAQLEGLGLTA